MTSCNTTQTEWKFHYLSDEKVIFFALCAVLIVSLLLNILCCMMKLCSGKLRDRQENKQRQSLRQMEENPIYGNLNYPSTCEPLYSEAAFLHSSLSSSSLRNPQRVSSDSQLKSQDCYANLTLKAPKPQSGRSSPQIHSEVAPSAAPVEVERGGGGEEEEEEEEGTTEAVSTVSELYASVQTQKTKIIESTDEAEEYANHL